MRELLKRMTIYILVLMALLNCIVPGNVAFAAAGLTDEQAIILAENVIPGGRVTSGVSAVNGEYALFIDNEPGDNVSVSVEDGKLLINGKTYAVGLEAIGVMSSGYEYTADSTNAVDGGYGRIQINMKITSATADPRDPFVFGETPVQLKFYNVEDSSDVKKVRVEYDDDGNVSSSQVVDPNEQLAEVYKIEDYDSASFIERLITVFFVTLGDGAMWAIGAVCGENISLDALFFDTYSNTRLAIFDGTSVGRNPILESGAKSGITKVYNIFSGIAIATFAATLLYIGIKILLGSTGRDKAKYKEYLMTWVKGALILFLFPFVMRLAIELNHAFVTDLSGVRPDGSIMPMIEKSPVPIYSGTTLDFAGASLKEEKDMSYMELMRENAVKTGRAVYAICWLILIIELVKFIIMYFKRLIMTIFLIAVFPLVTLTYAIDKVGDGKSQAFDNWFKEYMLNVFLQTFHALNYVIVMGIINTVGGAVTKGDPVNTVNYILVLVGITYIAKGEGILRHIFGQEGGVGTVKNATESLVKTAAAVKIAQDAKKRLKDTGKRISNLNARRKNLTDEHLRLAEAKMKEEDAKFRAENPNALGLEAYMALDRKTRREMRDDVATASSALPMGDGEAFADGKGQLSPGDLRKALERMNANSNNPAYRRELEEYLRSRGYNENEIEYLMDAQNTLAYLAAGRGLDIDFNTKIDILVNRQSRPGRSGLSGDRYDEITDNLLAAYGMTTESLLAEKDRLNEAKASYSSFGKNKKNRVKTKSTRGQDKRATQPVRVNGAGGKGTQASGAGESGGGYSSAGRRQGGRVAAQSRNIKNYKLANQKKKKKANGAAQATDPLQKTYVETSKDVVGNKRTAQKKRTQARVEAQRKENAKQKETKRIVENAWGARIAMTSGTNTSSTEESQSTSQTRPRYTQTRVATDTTPNASAAFIAQYAGLAGLVADAIDPDSTPLQAMMAEQAFDSEILNRGLTADDAAVKSMRAEMEKRTTRLSRDRINQMIEEQETRIEYEGGNVTRSIDEMIDEAAIAAEVLNTGHATLNELWWARDTLEDSDLSIIKDHLQNSLEEHDIYLAVETLNNVEDLQGTAKERQGIVDNSIRIIKEHQGDNNPLYKKLIQGLRFNPNTLKMGEMPVAVESDAEWPIKNSDKPEPQSKMAQEASARLREMKEAREREQQQYRDSIYRVGKSYDIEKEESKLKKKKVRLAKDIAREIVDDTAGAMGAVLGFSAHQAVDTTPTVREAVSATVLGSAAASNAMDSAINVVGGVSNEVIKTAKSIRGELNESRDGRNPIKLNKK
ncbi:MAG: hypothetical protein IJ217_01850 [Clostridia bacterium]|nr:hypothetical protein [Clostridia bacterium]